MVWCVSQEGIQMAPMYQNSSIQTQENKRKGLTCTTWWKLRTVGLYVKTRYFQFTAYVVHTAVSMIDVPFREQ